MSVFWRLVPKVRQTEAQCCRASRPGLVPFTGVSDAGHIRGALQHFPWLSEAIRTVVLTCCPYWWPPLLTWQTEQRAGEGAPQHADTCVYPGLKTFVLQESQPQTSWVPSHAARADWAVSSSVFRIVSEMVSGLCPLLAPDSMLLRKKDMNVPIRNPDKLVTPWILNLLRGSIQ